MAAEALLALGLGLCVLLYYNFFKAATCKNETSLRGKTVLITGGNTGIGKATAVDLARRGARVILACRNRARGESAVYDIRRESGNNEVLLMTLDLASLKSVRGFAESFLRLEPRLDILINNAGIISEGGTEDGFDLVFQVNHLGHFLLNHLLLDLLKRCEPSRIIVLASSVHQAGKVDFQEIHQPTEGKLRAFWSYCNSKLANVLYVRELANRLEGSKVTCYAVHPGIVDTELNRHLPWWLRALLKPFSQAFMRSCADGAQTTIYCATQEGIESLSGRYFADCRHQEPKRQAHNDAVAQKLWEFSERLLALPG